MIARGAGLAVGALLCFPTGVQADLADLPVNCAIRPLQVVEVAAPFPGIVRAVHVKPGQKVQAGDLIAEFDDDLTRATYDAAVARSELTASLATAQSQRNALIKKVERLKAGVKRRVVSAADLEAAELELALAEGSVARETDLLRMAAIEADQAKIALEKSQVFSPATGQIGEDLIAQGEQPSSKPIAIIYVNQPLRVEAFVPTAILGSFLQRDRFEIIVNGNRNAPVEVTIDYVSQVADLSSNSQSVYFTLDAPDIIPGYQCLFPPTNG